MNKFKDIAIGMVTGLLVVMCMFAMVAEAKTHTGLMGEDDQARIRKDLLSPIQWEFEGGMFTIPEGYDAILTQVYGDYMKLPPEDQRIQQHHYKAYLKEDN